MLIITNSKSFVKTLQQFMICENLTTDYNFQSSSNVFFSIPKFNQQNPSLPTIIFKLISLPAISTLNKTII